MNYPGNRKLLKTLQESKEYIEHLIEFSMIKETETFTKLLENITWSIQYIEANAEDMLNNRF